MKITLVKKIKADGSPCKKCEQVLSRLEKEGHLDRIDEIVPPGTDIGVLDMAYTPPSLQQPGLRRRPAAERSAA